MKLHDPATDPVTVAILAAVPPLDVLSPEDRRAVAVAARDACARELLAEMDATAPADGTASQRRKRGHFQRAIYVISSGPTAAELAAATKQQLAAVIEKAEKAVGLHG